MTRTYHKWKNLVSIHWHFAFVILVLYLWFLQWSDISIWFCLKMTVMLFILEQEQTAVETGQPTTWGQTQVTCIYPNTNNVPRFHNEARSGSSPSFPVKLIQLINNILFWILLLLVKFQILHSTTISSSMHFSSYKIKSKPWQLMWVTACNSGPP